jgi:hypothetical protein
MVYGRIVSCAAHALFFFYQPRYNNHPKRCLNYTVYKLHYAT